LAEGHKLKRTVHPFLSFDFSPPNIVKLFRKYIHMNRRQEMRPTRTFMQSMGNNARAIYKKQMIPNGLINKLLFGNSQIDLYQTELLVAVDQNLIMQIQEQITETRASNQATRKELEQIELSQRAQAEYQKFLDLIPKSNDARKKVDELVGNNKITEAYVAYATAFKPVRAEMIDVLELAVKYNEEDAKAFYGESIASFQTATTLVLLLSALAIVLCSAVAFLITALPNASRASQDNRY